MKKIHFSFFSALLSAIMLANNAFAFERDERKPYLDANTVSGTITRMTDSKAREYLKAVEEYEKALNSLPKTQDYFSEEPVYAKSPVAEGHIVYEPKDYVTKRELFALINENAGEYNPNFDPSKYVDNGELTPIGWDEAAKYISTAFSPLPEPKGNMLRNSPSDEEFMYLPTDEYGKALKNAGVLVTDYKHRAYPSEKNINDIFENIYALFGKSKADNFYDTVNKAFFDASTLPSDSFEEGKVTEEMTDYEDGTMTKATVDAKAAAKKLVEEIIKKDYSSLTEKEKVIRDFYDSILNKTVRNNKGCEPIRYYLDGLKAAKNTQEVFDFTLKYTAKEGSPFLNATVVADPEDTDKTMLYISPVSPNQYAFVYEEGGEYLEGYKSFIKELFMLSGYDETSAENKAATVISVEKKLARAMKGAYTTEEKIKLGYLQKYMNSFDLSSVIQKLGYKPDNEVVINEFEMFKALGSLFDGNHTEEIKTYAEFGELYYSGGFLSEDFTKLYQKYSDYTDASSYVPQKDETAADFALKTTLMYVDGYVGALYCDKFFTAEERKEVIELVDKTKDIIKNKLSQSTELSEDVKKAVTKKIDSMKIVVGYSDDLTKVLDSSVIANTEEYSYYENISSILSASRAYNASLQGKPTDAQLLVGVYDTSAFYYPYLNTINIPAGILSEPIYSSDFTYEQKLGSVGFIIAHEIMHCIDADNIFTDSAGKPIEQWKKEEMDAFLEKYEDIEALFDGAQIVNSVYTDSSITGTECYADIGAADCMLTLLSDTLENPDYKQFFEQIAFTFAETNNRMINYSLSIMDEHANGRARVNKCLQCFDKFYEVYSVGKNDGMYLKKEDRVNIWK